MRCWYTRWQLSNALDRGDFAARIGRGHAARCSACQTFGRSLAQLHDRLAAGAHAAAAPIVVRRARWPLIAAPLAVGAAALALVVTTGSPPRAPAPPPTVAKAAVRAEDISAVLSTALTETALDTELRALIHDGKRGLSAVLATSGLSWQQ